MDNLFDFRESFRKLIVTSNFPKVGVERLWKQFITYLKSTKLVKSWNFPISSIKQETTVNHHPPLHNWPSTRNPCRSRKSWTKYYYPGTRESNEFYYLEKRGDFKQKDKNSVVTHKIEGRIIIRDVCGVFRALKNIKSRLSIRRNPLHFHPRSSLRDGRILKGTMKLPAEHISSFEMGFVV